MNDDICFVGQVIATILMLCTPLLLVLLIFGFFLDKLCKKVSLRLERKRDTDISESDRGD